MCEIGMCLQSLKVVTRRVNGAAMASPEAQARIVASRSPILVFHEQGKPRAAEPKARRTKFWRRAVVRAMCQLLAADHPVPLVWVVAAQCEILALRWRGRVIASGVDHEHFEACFDQREGRGDAGWACADDDDVERHS